MKYYMYKVFYHYMYKVEEIWMFRDKRGFRDFQEPAPGSHSMLKNDRLPVNRIYATKLKQIKRKQRLFPTPSSRTSMDSIVTFALRLFFGRASLYFFVLSMDSYHVKGSRELKHDFRRLFRSVVCSRRNFIEILMTDNDVKKNRTAIR